MSSTFGSNRPLDGIRVVALEQAVSMPYCSFVLAELGADVIKIERPIQGDVLRGWDEAVGGLSSGYVWLNANKRDITIDVSTSSGKDIVRALATRADVFLENFAPGVVDRLGLSSEVLRALNERLIYCSLSGYGQDGPYRDIKAYDLIVQGEAGVLLANGYPDAPAKVGLPIVDLIAGSNAAAAVLAALLQRKETAVGAYLDVAMLDSAVSWLGYFPHRYWHRNEEPPRTGMRHQYIVPYGPYMAADERYVNLVVASTEHWRRFCIEVVEIEAWANDARYSTGEGRRKHRAELERAVEEEIARRPSDEWFARLAAAGLPFGRVRPMAEVVVHPQLQHREMIVEADSPVGPIPLVRSPLGPSDVARKVPALGEHTDAVLEELGFSASERADLKRQGVV